MKSDLYQEAVVTQTIDQVNAVVFSTDHLVGYNLSKTLAEHQLVVHLIHTQEREPFLPSPAPQVIQFRFDELTSLEHQGADYVFCIYPHRKDKNEFLSKIVDSCRKQASKLLIVEEYGWSGLESMLADLKKEAADVNTRIVLTSAPYGPNFGQTVSGVVSKWLLNIYNHEAIVLPSRGQEIIAPLYIDDLSQALIEAMFKTQTNHQVFLAGSLDNQPLLDLAHQIRNLAEETLGFTPTVDFSPNMEPLHNPPESAIAATQAALAWEPQTSLTSGLHQTLQYMREQSLPAKPQETVSPKIDFNPPPAPVQPKLAPLSAVHKKKRHTGRKHLRRILTFVIAICIFSLVSLPGGVFYWFAVQGATNLQSFTRVLNQGDPDKAYKIANTAKKQFAESRSALGIYRPFLFMFSQQLNRYDRLLDAAGRMAEMCESLATVSENGQDLSKYVLNNGGGDLDELVLQFKTNLETAFNGVSLIQVSLGNLDFSAGIEEFEKLNDLKKLLPDMKAQFQITLSVLDVLPKIIGSSQSVNLLIIVQNSNELRPTGGFNNSYALLTFKAGRLIDKKIDDIKSLDSKLDGHVDPPTSLKRHLGETNWYLRDANWSSDFPTTARQLEWFFEKEAGIPIAGVVTVDTNLLKDLTQVVGPLTLPISGQTVNDKNFAEVISQKNTDQNDDNLTLLSQALSDSLIQNSDKNTNLNAIINDSLSHKNILIFLNDSALQSQLVTNNWSGSVKAIPCPKEFNVSSCTSETLGLFEANVGVNQNNYYILRSTNHSVSVSDDGKITHTIDIAYTNQASQPGVAGVYKTYTRFVAPVGSQLQVNLDQVPVAIEDVNVLGTSGLVEFGFYYEIPSSSQKHLKLTLQSPQIVNVFSPQPAISIGWLKQPGTTSDSIYVDINFPAKLKSTQISMPATSEPQKLQFNTNFTSDLTFASEFKQK